jgi:hypothetical protein
VIKETTLQEHRHFVLHSFDPSIILIQLHLF